MATKMDYSELGNPDPDLVNVVLVLNSNLVVQGWSSGPFLERTMQITQVTRGNGPPTYTKSQLNSPLVYWRETLSDYSCPERLMFFQRGYVLECYRPAADIGTNFTSLTMLGISAQTAEILVTSSQSGLLAVQGSSNIANWQTVTNVQTSPGVTEVRVPATNANRFFYRGVRSVP